MATTGGSANSGATDGGIGLVGGAPSSGGAASGLGGGTGGNAGVSSVGGAQPQTGGTTGGGDGAGGTTPIGGAPAAGGLAFGGTAAGGTAAGGTAAGGTAAGGTAAGGTATGGTAAGGTAAGGTAAGGTAAGGTAAGGAPAGGATSGGTSPGGAAGGGGADGGAAGSGVGGALSTALFKDGESLIALSGLTVVSYGGYLNGESFQQDGIITHNGYQYAAFWNTNRHVVMARRQLPDGTWEKFELTDYANTADDAHNTVSLGICPGDGTLHLAFDHHGNDLHYRRSVIGLTTDPASAAWTASSFTAVTSSLESGVPIAQVTYPRFVTRPGGSRLLLAARIGSSGSGDESLWEYDASNQTWVSLGRFIDGITDSVNAYLHGLSYTRGGSRLHIAWCWRETPDATTNHDLFYAYSDDHGRSWQNNQGDTIATTGSAYITRDSSGAMVWGIGQNRGLINQEHMAVDAGGRVHVLLSHMPDSQADDSDFTSARTKSEFFHYWRDLAGSWHRNALGLAVIANFRGSLAVASTNNVYAILPDLRIAGASAASDYADWALLDATDSGRFFSDPLIDTVRLQSEDTLTIYYPEASSANIWALDYAVQ